MGRRRRKGVRLRRSWIEGVGVVVVGGVRRRFCPRDIR